MKHPAKFFLLILLLTVGFLFSLGPSSVAFAEWRSVKGQPVSPEEARRIMMEGGGTIPTSPLKPILPSLIKESEGTSPVQTSAEGRELTTYSAGPATSETQITPEIKELARGLRHDPKLIYNYIHNHIDYVPTFGSYNGATATLLAGRGNDWDQTSLFIALMRASGYTANYVCGDVVYRLADVVNWLGVEENLDLVEAILANGGIPIAVNDIYNYVKITRVWARATINGVEYVFDPAFKQYESTSGINLGEKMGYDQTSFLTSAIKGTTIGSDYIQNMHEANINSNLKIYSKNLRDWISQNKPNASMEEIIGGRNIVQVELDKYYTNLPGALQTQNAIEWTEIPDEYCHKLRIQYHGLDHTFATYQIAGKRVSLFHKILPSNPLRFSECYYFALPPSPQPLAHAPVLKVEDVIVAYGDYISCPCAIDLNGLIKYNIQCHNNDYNGELTITVNHAYPGSDADQSHIFNLNLNCHDSIIPLPPITPELGFPWCNSHSYVIVTDFEGVSADLIRSRNAILSRNRLSGSAENSEEILGESLLIMGLTWLHECELANALLAKLSGTTYVRHHGVGIMAQEEGYYIDIPMDMVSCQHIDENYANTFFCSTTLMASALEHGMLEQLQGKENPCASTVKLLQISNVNHKKIFFADSSNFTTIRSQLQNYSSSKLEELQAGVDADHKFILPEDANITLNEWRGLGYIQLVDNAAIQSIGMFISGDYGDYSGGYSGIKEQVDIPEVSNNISNNYTPISAQPIVIPASKDPVDLATGAFLHDHTDLSLGQAEPLGIQFSRSYNSSLNNKKGTLGYGWTHNYNNYIEWHSDGGPGLGTRLPEEAAFAMATFYICLDIMKEANLKNWVIASLMTKWLMDQLIDNAVTVYLGGKALEYMELTYDKSIIIPPYLFNLYITYNTPPGITSDLKYIYKNSLLGFYLYERFNSNPINFRSSIYFGNYIHKIISWPNADGNEMSFSYTEDKLTSVEDTFGRTLTFEYTGDLITSVSDSTGRSVSYGYDENDNLISYTDPEGKIWSYSYDNEHRMTSLTNPLGITTAVNTYDSLGRVNTQTVPRQGGANATYNFYFSGYRNIEEDPDGNTTIYYFDKKGRSIAEEDALGHKTSKEYDGQNHLISATDSLGHTTRFSYDGNHNLIKQTDPLGKSTYFTYDSYHRLISTKDPLNNLTQFEYGEKHHLILTIDAEDNQTSYTYYENGLLHTTTDANGDKTINTYDSYGNIASMEVRDDQDALQAKFTYTFNQRGDMRSINDTKGAYRYIYDRRRFMVSQKDPLEYITSYYYDGAGNQIRINRQTNDSINPWQINITYTPTGEKDSVTDPQGHVTNYLYDQHDRLIKIINAENQSTEYRYDKVGRIYQVIDVLGNVSEEYAYTPTGRKQSLKDSKGNITQYEYDERDQVSKITYPDTSYESFAYDDAGNLIQKRTRSGQILSFEYDSLNRIKTKTLPGPKQIQYSYDPVGRQEDITNSSVVIHHEYDGAGRLKKVDISPDGRVFPSKVVPFTQVEYEYDTAGNRIKLIYPDNYYVTYTYDSLNRPTHVREKGTTLLAKYDYDLLSRRVKVTYANGASTSYTYEIDNDLLSIDHQFKANNVSFNYTYNKIGSRMSRTVSDARYQYAPVRSAHNSYISNNLNQYSSVNTVPFSYDGDGNLISDGSNSYSYDVENHLLTVAVPEHSVNYTYDAKGRRVSKTVDDEDEETVYYVYDGDQVIMECIKYTSTSYGLLKRYVYGPGIDEPICMITEPVDLYYYYHYDGLGSVIALTNSVGYVVETYAYDPYGGTTQPSGVGNPYLYTGRRYDPEPSLYYYRARYYSPNLGRFLSVDPIGYEGGDLNLYAYVGNNPVMYVDPWGLEIWIGVRKADPFYLKPFDANHLFLWDTTANGGRGAGYGMAGSSGSGRHRVEVKPPPGSYTPVPGGTGKETEIMNYMKEVADKGIWIPYVNDCFTKVEDVLEHFDLEINIPFSRTGAIVGTSQNIQIKDGTSQKNIQTK